MVVVGAVGSRLWKCFSVIHLAPTRVVLGSLINQCGHMGEAAAQVGSTLGRVHRWSVWVRGIVW